MRGSTRPSFRVQPIGWLRARELPALVALAQASMSHDSLRSASLDRSNHIGLCEPRLDLPLPACELVAYLHRNEQCTGLGSRHALPAALADARVPCGARVSGRTRKLGPRASNKRARPRCARLPPSRCAPRRRPWPPDPIPRPQRLARCGEACGVPGCARCGTRMERPQAGLTRRGWQSVFRADLAGAAIAGLQL